MRIPSSTIVLAVASVFTPHRLTGDELDALVKRIPVVANGEEITQVEQEFARKIQSYGAAAVPRLLPLLTSPSADVRDLVGYTLRDIDGLTEEHLDALIGAMKRGNGWIPPALARVGTARALAFLVEDLKANPETQTQVTYALELFGERAALALASCFRQSEPLKPEFARCVAEVCSELGERASSAIDPLLAIAADEKALAAHRGYAVDVLGSMAVAARRATPVLRSLAQADPETFAERVNRALMAFGGPDGCAVFVEALRTAPDECLLRDIAKLRENGRDAGVAVEALLTHANPDIRTAAARTLGYIRHETAVDALICATSDADDWKLVYAAIGSLGRMRARVAMPSIERLASEHWYPPVRGAAREALAVMRGEREYTSRYPPRNFPFEFFDYSSHDEEDQRTEALPDFIDGPDALTAGELAILSYPIEVRGYDEKGEHVRRRQARPGCGLRIDNGVLVGATRGEWGGEVAHLVPGEEPRTLINENTLAIHRTPAGIVAVTGLTHLVSDRGALFRIEIGTDGSSTATWWKRLPGCPIKSGLLRDGSLFVRCRVADVVISPKGEMRLAPLR